jgi:hypothetical protein
MARTAFSTIAERFVKKRHISARFADDGFSRRRPAGNEAGRFPMDQAQSLLADIDRICGQFALALHNSEPYVYAALTIAVLFGVLLFPPRNDPDQI